MKRLIAYVSGRVQQVGYRSRAVTIARALDVKGSIQNLPDGRVKVIADGEEADLERFANALKMNNAIIDVTGIEREYSKATGKYENFYKLVGEGETDERLDKGVEYLKELVEVARDGFGRMDKGFGELGNKMDLMLDKQDKMLDKQDMMLDKQDMMLDKQDMMLEKQDVVIEEVRGIRYDLKSYMESKFERIECEIGKIKGALREKGII
jgi:Acylphosphatases